MNFAIKFVSFFVQNHSQKWKAIDRFFLILKFAEWSPKKKVQLLLLRATEKQQIPILNYLPQGILQNRLCIVVHRSEKDR